MEQLTIGQELPLCIPSGMGSNLDRGMIENILVATLISGATQNIPLKVSGIRNRHFEKQPLGTF